MVAIADRRPLVGYWLGVACTVGQIAWSWHIGPQPKGEHPAPSLALWIANQLGFWALGWLVATLACSPLRWWTGASWPGRWRKRLGLTTFALAVLHVGVWVFGEKSLDLKKILTDLLATPWLLFGLAAFVGLLLLAATTPLPVMRWLGGARWQRVHRAIYAVAVLACVHYAVRDGADPQHWIGFSLAVAGLLWVRWTRQLGPSKAS